MTFARIKRFLRTREGIVLSALLHILLIGWGLLSLATRPLEASPQDIVPVDVISDDKLSQMMKGIKNGAKGEQKPLGDKVADAKPVDDAIGKVDDKKPPIQPNADKQTPKVEDKPIEKLLPPKPVAQDKPKDEPKPADKKDEPKIDQIAEKLKQDPSKDPPKPEAKQTPQPPKPKKDYVFDASKTMALLDKRDPTRQSVTNQELNPKSAIGTSAGAAQKLTKSWVGALQKRISDCWSVPAGIRDADTMEVRIQIRLGTNGMLQGHPQLVEAPLNSLGPAFAESAIRAIEQCQPYSFLPQAEYKGGWDYMDMTFSPRDLFRR